MAKRFFKQPQREPEVTVLKPKKLEFPSISLNIPERLLQSTLLSPTFLTAFTCGFLLMAIGIVFRDLRSNVVRLRAVNYERAVVGSKIAEWQGVVGQFKGYRDGYYQLAVLEYQLGDYNKAYEYIQKVIAIDPGYTHAKELLEKIEER